MKDLQVKVFLTGSSDRPVFERIVSLSHSTVVPYSQLEDSLRFMFGLKCVVSFNIQLV